MWSRAIATRTRRPGAAASAGPIVSRDECLRLNPLIDPDGVTGGAVWHDYQMHNTDRMTFSFVLRRRRAAPPPPTTCRRRRSFARRTRRRRAGSRPTAPGAFDIRAHTCLNAAGPWADVVLTAARSAPPLPAARLSRAMNLIADAAGHQGCGGRAGGRFLFLIPWRDVSLVGTSHDAYDGASERLARHVRRRGRVPGRKLSEAFPRGAPDALGTYGWSIAACCRWSPATGRSVALLKESLVVDHAASGHPGLVSIFSVRYTTARHTAEAAVDAVVRRLGKAAAPLRHRDQPRQPARGSPASRACSTEARARRRCPGTDASAARAPGRRPTAPPGTTWRPWPSQIPGLGHPLVGALPDHRRRGPPRGPSRGRGHPGRRAAAAHRGRHGRPPRTRRPSMPPPLSWRRRSAGTRPGPASKWPRWRASTRPRNFRRAAPSSRQGTWTTSKPSTPGITPHVRRFALFLTGDPARADDLAAETFVRAWTARDWICATSVRAYLLAITRNLHRDEWRRQARLTDLDDRVPDTSPAVDERAEPRRSARRRPPRPCRGGSR